MSDNRKYYYLKLKENYFDDDSIVLLESMQDGVLYSNILLKLYLKSLKHGGRLQLDEGIPYTAQMIATITRQQIGTVERALQIFLKLGLVEVLDSGTFYMSNIELLIGQSSTEAERKRAARLQNKALSALRTSGGHLSDIRPPEIELEKEIEIKREIEKVRPETGHPSHSIILVCIASFAIRGLSQSIDFTGGRNYKVQFEQAIEPEQVRELIASKFGDANVSVIAIGTDKKTVRISTNYRIEEEGNNVDSEIEAYLYETLKPLLTQNISLATFIDRDNHTGGSIISSQKVGPSIADDIKTSAVWSVVLALIAIGLYILLRFRNIAYSVGSVVALTSDTIMIIGAYSLLWGFVPFSLEIDQTFIGAILTAIGYSINDKVVIFDRVREFFGLYPKRNKRQLFNDSLNTTLARTINTSLSTLIVLLCIFILGGDSIRSFAFAMILGVIIGTLSSLFIASPIAYTMLSKKKETAETTAIEAE